MRINSINQVAPKAKKVLQLLRSRQTNDSVFIKLDKVTKLQEREGIGDDTDVPRGEGDKGLWTTG